MVAIARARCKRARTPEATKLLSNIEICDKNLQLLSILFVNLVFIFVVEVDGVVP